MCGRFRLTLTWPELVRAIRGLYPLPLDPDQPDIYQPSWNLCPTDPVPVLLHPPGQAPSLPLMRWGFDASWSRGRPIINARIEKLDGATWSASLRTQRCVVPATGWYEWLKSREGRWPVLHEAQDGGLLGFAALWRRWNGQDCVTVLTCPASERVQRVHDRMPVVLTDWSRWLEAPEPPLELLAPAQGIGLREASRGLGRVRDKGPELDRADWRYEEVFGAFAGGL